MSAACLLLSSASSSPLQQGSRWQVRVGSARLACWAWRYCLQRVGMAAREGQTATQTPHAHTHPLVQGHWLTHQM